MLSRQDILDALESLAAKLHARGAYAELVLAGGGALALGFNARPSTADLDVFVLRADLAVLFAAAREVATERGLPARWLNDDITTHGISGSRGRELYARPGLRVYSAEIVELLAMKLAAWRDDQDISDALLLLGKTSLFELEQAWSQIGGLIPPDKQGRARHNLETLLEMADGSP